MATALEVAIRASADLQAAKDIAAMALQMEQLNAAVQERVRLLQADLQLSEDYMDSVIADQEALLSAFFAVTANSLDVDFVDNSFPGNATILNWLWDFGDGAHSTLQNPSHSYALAGTYTVTLTVTDSLGLSDSFSTTVTAVVDPDTIPPDPILPVASFTKVVAGHQVTFTDTSTANAPNTVASWLWDFGEHGTASFTYVPTGLSVAFTDTSTKPAAMTITNWLWNFGDGATSTTQSPTHVYAAGGAKNVNLTVTTNNGQTNTINVSVLVTSGASLGIPLGVTGAWADTIVPQAGLTSFSLRRGPDSAANVLTRMAYCATNSLKMIFVPTGGDHTAYTTGGVFDRAKWSAKIQTFNTPQIQASMATSVASAAAGGAGVLAATIMDEPFHPSWGPTGTMTKAIIDDMASELKAIFPTLPVGVDHGYDAFDTTHGYRIIDYVASGVGYQQTASLQDQINGALAMAARDGHNIVFNLNIIDGGTRIKACHTSAAVCCPTPATGGLGSNLTAGMTCRHSPSQIQTAGLLAGPQGVALTIWKWDATAFTTGPFFSGNLSAFAAIKADLDTRPRKSWLRP